MRHAKLLDCTLRDGAYLIDKHFGDNNIRGIIDGLVKSRIEYIEIGFFQDEGFGEGKTVYRNSEDAARYIPTEKGNSQFTVLADYSHYSIENLDECRSDFIDAVRECFFKEERFEAIEVCRTIKEKGYKLFVQPVDILGYSDGELIEFIEKINEIEPYCLSIVDTFGSMYQEDLRRAFEIINHNLVNKCKIGFHSHNNMQLSNALSQEFLRMTVGKRECVIDGTISGMGRGAGNTPTELIAQYMVSKFGYNYDIDALLDVIDGYMDNIRAKCKWGYNTQYFVAGAYGAHVNNIQYLSQKNSIHSKDIRYILNKIGENSRKRYDYDLLEKTYMEYMESDVDDTEDMEQLKKIFDGKNILIVVPGESVNKEINRIKNYISTKEPVVICVNFLYDEIHSDYIYLSNFNRYNFWKNSEDFKKVKKIVLSNIKQCASDNEIIISFKRLIKCGWEHMDNSTILLLRLLDCFEVKQIGLAGFDGFDNKNNYALPDLEIANANNNATELNCEIRSMYQDYLQTRRKETSICFLTKSRFAIREE